MTSRRFIGVIFCLMLTLACSSIPPYQNTALDTPSRHVHNGMQFLDMGKIETAVHEFNRAIELDPKYSPAYTGLGLACGRKGDFNSAYRFMEKSRMTAVNPDQQNAVANGWMQLDHMKKTP